MTRTRHPSRLLIAVALACAPLAAAQAQATAPAQTQRPGGDASPTRLASADRTFVRQAAAGGMAEVALGELAQKKGATDAVKQFGQKMVADHGKANQELMQIATGKGLTPPAEPTPQQKSDAKKLEAMSGTAFDRAYAAQMVTDHRKTIALFEKQAKSGRDADLKAFAEKTLPALQEHYKMARDLHGQPMVQAPK